MKRWGIILLLALLTAGCGQPKQKVRIETNLPPVDFSIKPPAENLEFTVEGSQVMEVMGTNMESSYRFQWRAGNWRDEDDGSRTATVRFSKVAARERRGQMATLEPIKSFDRLEGFSTKYRLDAEGFAPVAEPARDEDFMMAFTTLSQGLSALDFRWPEAQHAPGEEWTIVMDVSELGPMSEIAQDSIVHLKYTGNQVYKGRNCARLEARLSIPLDGRIEQGPATSHVVGSIESTVTRLFDLEKHFFILTKHESVLKIKGQDFDEEGKALGGEKNFAQNGFFEITYLGF
jgi:hypothetical protein